MGIWSGLAMLIIQVLLTYNMPGTSCWASKHIKLTYRMDKIQQKLGIVFVWGYYISW